MSPESNIRVLIADDSSTARALLGEILRDDGRFQLVGEAKDGLEAITMAAQFKPDVIMMDIHMPGLGGVEAARRIMDENPTPIVMITAARNHADIMVTLNALNAGALGVLHKPVGPGSPDFTGECLRIVATVKAVAGIMVMRRRAHAPTRLDGGNPAAELRRGPVKIVAMAASTGGPAAVREILSELPFPLAVPVLIVQHITEGFGPGLAEWLGEATRLTVKLAVDNELLMNGTVYVAPDHRHLGVSRALRIALSDAAPVNGSRPSATHLFRSVASVYGSSVLAIILTGMGQDGVAGLRDIRAAGGFVLAQDEDSCVVFGMPGAAIAANLVDAVFPLDEIAVQIGRAIRHV